MPARNIDLIRELEEISANAWRAAVCQQLWGWQLGYSGGTSRRVNSVLSHHLIGPVRLQERFDRVNQFYRDRERHVVYKISPATLPTNLSQKLVQAGYEKDAATTVQVAEIEALLSASELARDEIQITAELDETWFQTYTGVSGYAPESLPIRRGIFDRIAAQAGFVLLRRGGVPVAAGLGVYERGWLGVYCLVTDPEFRRRGYASQAMHTLADWGTQQGAARVYLQVMENNPTALALYRKLGFEKLYTYYYLGKDC